MRFRVLSRKFYNQVDNGIDFTDNLATFDQNLTGSVMERKRFVTDFEVQIETVATATETIDLYNSSRFVRNSGSWKLDGWQSGMTFVVIKDLTHNPAVDFKGTVTSVNDLEMQFTVTSGTANNATLGNHQIAAYDLPNDLIYKFGIIENQDPNSFISLIDGSEQGYYLKNVTTVEQPMTPLGVNRTWQTGECKVKNYAATAPYVSGENTLKKYTVTHDFVIPYFNSDVINGEIPSELDNLNSLKYIFEVDCRRNIDDPNSGIVGVDSSLQGNVGWFNESFNGFNAEYGINGYTIEVDGEVVNELQKGKDNVIKAILQSNSLFTAVEKIGVYHSVVNEVVASSQTQNDLFRYENVFGQVGAVTNGNIIKAVSAMFNSVDDIELEFTVSYTDTDLPDSYVIGILLGNEKRIMLPIFGNYAVSTDQLGLATITKLNIINHRDSSHTDYKGWIEDGILIDWGFSLDKSITNQISSISVGLIATNGATSFDIQRFNYPLIGIVNQNGVQRLLQNNTRGFKLANGDDKNSATISETYDPNTEIQQWSGKLGLKIDWQDWIRNNNVDAIFYDPTKQFNGFNQNSSNYSLKEGFELKISLDIRANSTDYRWLSPTIVANNYNLPNTWTAEVKTYDLNGNNTQLNLIEGEDMVFEITWTPSNVPFETNDFFAIHRIEESGQNGYGIYELSSYETPLTGINPLANETFLNAPKLFLDIQSNKVISKCIIKADRIKKGFCYKLSGRIGIDGVLPPLVEWVLPSTYDSATSGTTGKFTVEIDKLHKYSDDVIDMTDGSPIKLKVLQPLNSYSLYTSGTYNIGDKVLYNEGNINEVGIYESLINGNTSAPTDLTKWGLVSLSLFDTLETLTGTKATTLITDFTSVLKSGMTTSILDYITFGAAIDADAAAYLTAVGIPNDSTVYYSGTPQEITGAEIWTAVNDWFVSMKGYGLYTEIEVARLFIGGTATAHKWNAVNPLDTNAAHRAVFSGGGTHSATGYQLNGTNSYADGNWQMTDLGVDSNSIHGYQRLNASGVQGYILGVRTTNTTNKAYVTSKWTDGLMYFENNNNSGFLQITTNAFGFFGIQRISSSQVQTFKNGTLNAAQSLTRTAASSLNMFEGATNFAGNPSNYNNNELCYIGALKRHLTAAEHTNYYNTIQALQTALKRNV